MMNKIKSPVIPFQKGDENKIKSSFQQGVFSPLWFTLVELIVVITILAILATIWFVSFSGYLAGTRDTNRKAQLKSMSDALELYRTKQSLPIPDDKVDVKVWTWSNERVIAYQWYIWKNVLESIEYTESWLDPKDKTYFSYYLSRNKKYYQLLAFLEEPNKDVVVAMNSRHPEGVHSTNNVGLSFMATLNAADYSQREVFVSWKKLWILVEDETNIPIQELPIISWSWYLNVETTNDTYKAILENLSIENWVIRWTWSTLKMIAATAWVWWVKNSCKVILEKDPKLRWKDWYYLINQESPTKVYCDMTTNRWGRTRYINITWDYSFEDAKKCWLAKSSWTNWSGTIECYNPNRLNFVVSEYMVKQDFDSNWNWKHWIKKFKESYPSQIEKVNYNTTRKCKWGKEYMTVMSPYSSWYPNNDLINVSRVRLWLSFCDENNWREIWWRAWWTNYMNYSYNWENWPNAWKQREQHARPAQMFVR